MTDTVTILDPQYSIPAEAREALMKAAGAAARWNVTLRPNKPGSFRRRVAAARSAVQNLEHELAKLPESINDSDHRIIGLLDLRGNPRVLRSAVTGVEPKPRERDALPRVTITEHQDEPRVATLSATYLLAIKGQPDAVTFPIYLRELQAHEPLTLDEIWSIPAYLRFCMLEAILAESETALRDRSNEADVRVQRLFSGLRDLGNIDWSGVLEPLIVFDAILRKDPTGTYSKMDFETRDMYRTRVAFMARHSDCTELQVAEKALDLAIEASHQPYKDPRIQQRCSHIGYHLVSRGISRLAERINFHAPPSYRIRSAIRANADDVYITGIELITIFFIAVMLFPLLPSYPVFPKLAITFVLMIMPVMQCAVELMNNSITAIFDAEPLAKMDYAQAIPNECATLVAVPTLLLNEKQVRDLVDELEVRYLANRDPNLHFALLTDLPDSVSKPHEKDSNPLVDLAIQLINGLNARYGSAHKGGFLFLHRHRIFNIRQGVWMGWERKRGKLLDLNKLLVGEYDAFPIKAGRLDVLNNIRYILTLDSDTQLPRGTAARMVGAIAHPLNQAIIDPKLRIVVEGYGILQPRVGVSVSSASRTRLASLYSGQAGFDVYARAVSDAYQDLYGEGIFTGKGIYEVSALHAVLNKRFPRNSLLSHDLIEGAYARAGLVTDVEVIDDYPSHYSAYTRRKHRWVRGDWQIAQWMFARVPDESGKLTASPISTVSRWKIFDNLRRSLVEPFTFILFVAGWLWLPGGPLYWTILLFMLFMFPTIVQFAFGVGRAIVSKREGAVSQALEGSGEATLLALLNLSFLPHQAMLEIDAVVRALIRRFITGERLLEWETAAEAESQTRKLTPVDRYLALMPLVACVLAVIVYFFAHQRFAFLVAAPMLLLWCMSAVLTAWLNRPPQEAVKINAADRSLLFCHALRIWRYFHEFGTERHNYLIPDNVEENGLFEAARVSPTNVGLLLNSRQAAVEFGFLCLPEFAHLTEESLATIGRLEKHRGHLYNWYDTHTCAPLEANPFVSSVDSGNFVASLYTLHTGTLSLLRKPLVSRTLFTALTPYWEMAQHQGKLSGPIAKLAMPSSNASLSDWLNWAVNSQEAFRASSVLGLKDAWWQQEMHKRIDAILHVVRNYVPWLDPRFAQLRETPEFGITPESDHLNVDDAAAFCVKLQKTLYQAPVATNARQVLAAQLREMLPNTARNLNDLSLRLRGIAQQAERFAEETDFSFLISPARRILSIGYDVRKQRVHEACYDMLASEARTATFLAIARGDIGQQSWFRLGRDFTFAFGTHVLMSWTGTMFEYLMPALWMRRYPNTLLSDTVTGAVRVQQAFARSLGLPWGISESGSSRKDDAGHYSYHAYGVPHLALSFEATAGPVVSPYSTFLALGVDLEESIRNLRRMASAGWVGAFGFYESVDYSTGIHNGEIVREWMAHHQGMSLLALLNCLCDDVVQHWFHSNALVQSAELLLHEVPRSKAALRAMMKDFAFVRQKYADAA
ncbi:glucoamylase family protein [Occallatibacter riparius]|uniref:Glycosyl transferase n=1 Tax=Occallatibacter riparius TaxID=1002689 RepID=A0A9J7BMC6_9BACT|nr:glucoamylase family protein [Occallatibacter riparius]UWZ83649.1 glycosyl transferase [Occallatibacter riparius]